MDTANWGKCLGYTGKPCPNCGRVRLERYDNGKEVCEKCEWCPQEGRYIDREEMYAEATHADHELIVERILEAHQALLDAPVDPARYFRTAWLNGVMTDEACIAFFEGDASVIVIDSQERRWNKGQLLEGERQ